MLLVRIMQCIVVNRIGNINFYSKLPIITYQINSISWIESEEFTETSIVLGELLNLKEPHETGEWK